MKIINKISVFSLILLWLSSFQLGYSQSLPGVNPTIHTPEVAAPVGSFVGQLPHIYGPDEVLGELKDILSKEPDINQWITKTAQSQYPKTKGQVQLQWLIAKSLASANPLADLSVWQHSGDDYIPALVAITRGFLVLGSYNWSLEVVQWVNQGINEFFTAMSLNPGAAKIANETNFPENGKLKDQMIWATQIHIAGHWNPFAWEVTNKNPFVLDLLNFTAAAIILKNNFPTQLKSRREVININGENRVYAIHQPSTKRPDEGYPAIVMLHGSIGGYAPEQAEWYQYLNQAANQFGYVAIYPVGSPQDRSDYFRTGRGLLNWEPFDSEFQGQNEMFIFTVLKKYKNSGLINPEKIYVAGHSSGGFYTATLLANYPETFAGAAILGAGLSYKHKPELFKDLKTPLYLFCGQKDIHAQFADKLEEVWTSHNLTFKYDRPADRGHEIQPNDFVNMIEFFMAN